jgi:hypothetical protein
MSSAESFNPDRSSADGTNSQSAPPIETVYTTVESQADRTDWLTVVSNLRQVERQLVEQIARLEQALASTKQELHDRKAENQNHEITILQHQDELKIARDRVGGLFQQLENSHQIGQRQQILIESLSQQLEIAHTVIPQLEAENEALDRKYTEQAQKLDKTERVAVELHRRLKLQSAATNRTTVASPAPPNPASLPVQQQVTAPVVPPASVNFATSAPVTASAESATADSPVSEDLSMEVAVPTRLRSRVAPEAPSVDREMPAWTATNRSQKSHTAPTPPSWREAIASNNAKYVDLPNLEPNPFAPKPPTVTAEQLAEDDTEVCKPSANWPSPTLDRNRPVTKKLAIDLPKFPKKQES